VTDVSVPVTSNTLPVPAAGPPASAGEEFPWATASAGSAHVGRRTAITRAQLMALRILSYVRTHSPCWRASMHQRLVSSARTPEGAFGRTIRTMIGLSTML